LLGYLGSLALAPYDLRSRDLRFLNLLGY